jgi:hypothetical protein
MSKGLVPGTFLCLLALLLGGLFFIKSYPKAYWSIPDVFFLTTSLGVLWPLPGSLLLGTALRMGQAK